MPTRPPLHQPPGSGAERRAHAERDRERLALRPSAAERGYDDDWRTARAIHLAAFPVCSSPDCGKPATDVDHVMSVADHPEIRLDPSNFRSYCHSHHSQRTARDQGFAQAGGTEPKRGARHPEWMRPACVPVTLVAGPPGAGKSRYVQHRAGANDLVLDYDVIVARLSGRPLYHSPSLQWVDAALRWRNGYLSLLNYVHRWPSAWLIVAEPREHWRQWWVDKLGARVVVMETDAETCRQRILDDERRPHEAKSRGFEGVDSWWRRYERRDADLVLVGDRATTGRARRSASP